MFKRIKAQTKNKNKTAIREKGRKVRGKQRYPQKQQAKIVGLIFAEIHMILLFVSDQVIGSKKKQQ